MNSFAPHSAQGLTTMEWSTADSGLRDPCPRRAVTALGTGVVARLSAAARPRRVRAGGVSTRGRRRIGEGRVTDEWARGHCWV
jgi:hypothetical protein